VTGDFILLEDGSVLAVTDNDVQYTLCDYRGALIAIYPGGNHNGHGATMTEIAYTAPFCRPPGEAWQHTGDCTRDGLSCWVWRRLWALALGGA